jgi:hypothetical protein
MLPKTVNVRLSNGSVLRFEVKKIVNGQPLIFMVYDHKLQ